MNDLETGISSQVARKIAPLLCSATGPSPRPGCHASSGTTVAASSVFKLPHLSRSESQATTIHRVPHPADLDMSKPQADESAAMVAMEGVPQAISLGPSQQAPVPAHAIPQSKLAVIRLGDDSDELVFDKTTVMHPPAMRFSMDIGALFREWHESTHLVVNGRPIPIKHWGDVYKKCTGENGKAWALRKVQWGQWKVSRSSRSASCLLTSC